jgi:integrase
MARRNSGKPDFRAIDRLVRSLPAPPTGNKVYKEPLLRERGLTGPWVPGLAVRVTAAGARSWVLGYRAKGIERRFTIGSIEGWPAEKAWEGDPDRDPPVRGAAELRRVVDAGEDPLLEREAARRAPTVDDLAKRYREEYLPRKRASSAAEDAIMLRQHVEKRLGRLQVQAVSHDDIDKMHRAISKDTPTRANRVLALTSKLFSLAVEWKMRTDNPCRGIKKNAETKRERYLSPDELQRLSRTLEAHPYKSSANAIRLLLLTGARRAEVLGARWHEFDLGAGVWMKPANRTKAGKLHRIPLSAPALQLLEEMREQDTGEMLFPGRRGGEQQTTLKTFWHSICRTAELSDLRLHDLRHTFASHLASGGQSLLVIGQLLGHADISTTQRYSHLFDDVQRRAVETVGAIIAGAASAEVVPLRRKG